MCCCRTPDRDLRTFGKKKIAKILAVDRSTRNKESRDDERRTATTELLPSGAFFL